MLELQDVTKRIGARGIRLRVHRDNTPALSLYRSLGYREGATERGEIVMVMDL